jgi:glutathione S-transferase
MNASAEKSQFFDMGGSSMGARIHLWLAYRPEIASQYIETKIITAKDLQTPEYGAINPMRKAPALVRPDGSTVFESAGEYFPRRKRYIYVFYEAQAQSNLFVFFSPVILSYLEDKYGPASPPSLDHTSTDTNLISFIPATPELRQLMHMIIVCHDLYVASPNSTMPGITNTHGAMYLAPIPASFTPAARAMDRPTRAKKIQELWEQLKWLNDNMIGDKYLLGNTHLSLADLTWYPGTINMEFILPRVFGWPQDLFTSTKYLPKLAKWWAHLTSLPAFAAMRQSILDSWISAWDAGNVILIAKEAEDPAYQWSFPVQWEDDFVAILDYQEPPPPGTGKRTGGYVPPEQHTLPMDDEHVLVNKHVPQKVTMHEGRKRVLPATLDACGFFLARYPSAVLLEQSKGGTSTSNASPADCLENDIKSYYDEMKALVQSQTGASEVFVFDHKICTSSTDDPLKRVHCDYTEASAHRRLLQLGRDGSLVRAGSGQALTESNVKEFISGRRFAFINVWRSIDTDNPVLQSPLAVCDSTSAKQEDRLLHELHFPNRVDEDYSLRFNPCHEWYTFSRMTHDECLVFKSFDSQVGDTTQFGFHAAYDDPRGGFKAPPRQYIEVRSIVVY